MRLKLNEHFPDLIAMFNRNKKDRTVAKSEPGVDSMSPFSDCPHTIIDPINLVELALALGNMVIGELLCKPFFNGLPTGLDT